MVGVRGRKQDGIGSGRMTLTRTTLSVVPVHVFITYFACWSWPSRRDRQVTSSVPMVWH